MFRSDFIRATSSLTGAIIGVGIFGVPFVFAQVGLSIGAAFFVVLTVIVLLEHVMYAEVIERTRGRHRLVGYANVYFGKFAKDVMSVSVLLGISGALVAYIAFANAFLTTLFGPLFSSDLLWGVVFWAVMGAGIAGGIKVVTRTEVLLFGFLFVAFLLIMVRGIPLISVDNFLYSDTKNFFLPYGVILFSLVGFSVVPEIRDTIRDGGKRFRNAIVLGVLIAAAVTFLFGAVVLGVSGRSTSPEAIGGLAPFLGPSIIYIGSIFGFLAVTTSFLIIGINLKDTLRYDWKIRNHASTIITIFVPLFLFLIGLRNFIETIGIVGAIFGAVDGTMIALLFLAAKRRGQKKPGFSLNLPRPIVGGIIFSLVLAGVYVGIDVIIKYI